MTAINASERKMTPKKIPSERQLQIADRMKKEMLRSGLTQEEIATRMGKKPPAVSRWLSGLNEPDADTMAAFAAVVGCPAAYLWTGEYPMTEESVQLGVVECLLGLFKGRSMRTTFEVMTTGPYQAGGVNQAERLLELEIADPYAYHVLKTLIPDWQSLPGAELAKRIHEHVARGLQHRR